MASYTITFSTEDLPNATYIVRLRDESSIYGVRNADTEEVIIDAGADMEEGENGQYTFELEELSPGAYEYVVEIELVELDQTVYEPGAFNILPLGLPTYLTVEEAVEIAPSLVDLPAAWSELTVMQQAMQLSVATMRLDQIPWQGEKYEGEQELQFPRFDGSRGWTLASGWGKPASMDQVSVPNAIKLACLYEAASLADGRRREITDAIANGLVSQSVGKRSESYRPLTSRGVVVLCSQADDIVGKFKLKDGSIA